MKWFKLIISLLLVSLTALAKLDGPFSDDFKKNLAEWGSRHKEDSGTLLNPPIGSKSIQVKKIEALVREIVATLDPELAKTFQLTIGVYPSNEANAFMENVNAEKHSQVLTQLYKVDTKKPVYHLGVTIGLINAMQTVDQLAFVISHELTHLKEGHVDDKENESHKDKASRWWSGQRIEAIADHIGIKQLVGKYDLQAAIDTLWILAELSAKNENSNTDELSKVSNALNELLSSHHDPSVRISMAQAFVAFLRKTDGLAVPRIQKSLPEELGRLRNNRSYNNLFGKNLDWPDNDLKYVQDIHDKLIETAVQDKLGPHFKADVGLFSIAHGWLGLKDLNGRLIISSMSWNSLQKLVGSAIQKIRTQSDLTAEQKIVALIASYKAYRQYNPGTNLFPTQFQDIYAREILGLLQSSNVNLVKVFDTLRISPDEFLKEPLFLLLTINKSGLEIFNRAVRSQLYNNQKSSDPVKMSLWVEDNFANLNKFKFENVLYDFLKRTDDKEAQLKREAHLFPALLDSPYARLENKLMMQELDRHASYFDSRRFTEDIIGSKSKESTAFEVLSFIGNIKRKFYAADFAQSLFLQKALEKEASILKYLEKKKNRFFSKIKNANREFTPELVEELSQVFNMEDVVKLTQDDKAILAKNWFKLVESHIDHNYEINNVGLIIDLMNEENLIPISTDKLENIKSLIFLSRFKGLRKPLDYAKIAELFKSVSLNEIKKIVSTYYFTQGDADFAQEMKSENYQKQLEKTRKSKATQDLTMDDFFSNDSSMMTSLYFHTKPERISEDEQKNHFSLLELLSDETISKTFSSQFTIEDVQNIIKNIHLLASKERNRKRIFVPDEIKDKVVVDTLDKAEKAIYGYEHRFKNGDFKNKLPFLFDVLASRQNEFKTLEAWAKLLRSLLNISETAIDMRPDLKQAFEAKFMELSNQGQNSKAYLLVRNSSLQKTLGENSLVPVMLAEIKRRMGNKTSVEELNKIFEEINVDQKLKDKSPDIYEALRRKVAEEFKLQPHNINQIFPRNDLEINTKNSKGLDTEVRGLSAIVALARTRDLEGQMQLIDYIMGRTGVMPAFIKEWEKDVHTPIHPFVYDARIKLQHETELSRAFIINSLLTGPAGVMNKPGFEEFLLNRFFSSSPNKTLIKEISQALLRSLGTEKSLAVSYVLAQKGNSNGKIDEGVALRSLLEAFGVAGIKLGQYLGFTSELKDFQLALGALQDSAMPVSYLEMLHLVRLKLGESWSRDWEIVKLLGSGSVNVAIEVKSPHTGEVRVISILREDIQVAAREDFRKLTEFVKELIKVDSKRYGFLVGLLKIIEVSVNLEFDKSNSRDRLIDAGFLYNEKVNGWKLQTPKSFGVANDTLIMSKANGKTARKIRTQNFELYKETMGILLKAELENLINGQFIRLGHFPTISNPDVHDGQVIIDAENKTITILDFGQAVSINKEQRDLGLQFLRIIEGSKTKEDMTEQILKFQSALGATKNLTKSEITEVFNKTKSMDRFVFLLSYMQDKNWKVPLATVHYILAINRAKELGDTIGYNVSKRLEIILKTREVTSSTELGYYLTKLIEKTHLCKDLF